MSVVGRCALFFSFSVGRRTSGVGRGAVVFFAGFVAGFFTTGRRMSGCGCATGFCCAGFFAGRGRFSSLSPGLFPLRCCCGISPKYPLNIPSWGADKSPKMCYPTRSHLVFGIMLRPNACIAVFSRLAANSCSVRQRVSAFSCAMRSRVNMVSCPICSLAIAACCC